MPPQTLTTYKILMANKYFWADYHINATSKEEALSKARTLADEGELGYASDEEYEAAQSDDRYDPDRSDYTYNAVCVEPADDYDQRADESPHHLGSGGKG